MRSAAEYKEILARFKKEYGDLFGIKELGIFGSVARGEHSICVIRESRAFYYLRSKRAFGVFV